MLSETVPFAHLISLTSIDMANLQVHVRCINEEDNHSIDKWYDMYVDVNDGYVSIRHKINMIIFRSSVVELIRGLHTSFAVGWKYDVPPQYEDKTDQSGLYWVRGPSEGSKLIEFLINERECEDAFFVELRLGKPDID